MLALGSHPHPKRKPAIRDTDQAASRLHELRCWLTRIAHLSRDLGSDFQLYGRIKGSASISEKMNRTGLGAHQILDVIGIRVVTAQTDDCYRLVERVNCGFLVLADEYRDYNAHPKPNGYQSLHTKVVSRCGSIVEIQVRTHAMHRHAEQGAASHVRYKRVQALETEQRRRARDQGQVQGQAQVQASDSAPELAYRDRTDRVRARRPASHSWSSSQVNKGC